MARPRMAEDTDGEDSLVGADAGDDDGEALQLRDDRIRRLTASASAGQIHVFLKSLQATGNEIQLAFMEGLRALHQSRGFIEIGCSSFHQYCRLELGLSRSTAYEYLRCAEALANLPVTATMFRDGDLSWEQVKAISRVATQDTEVVWIQVALESSVRELLVEVRDAQRSGRDRPRKDRYGLPNLTTRMIVDLTLEEKERVLVALTRAAQVLGVSDIDGAVTEPGASGGDAGNQANGDASELEEDEKLPDEESFRDPDPRTALIALVDAILAGRFKVVPTRETDGQADPAAAVVYSGCSDCNRAKAYTRFGVVEIPPELLEERAVEARRMVIPEEAEFEVRDLAPGERDKPNSALLAKRVLHRDGLRCTSPGCGNRRGLQAHHMHHRADGGPTTMSNESTLCPPCHSLDHSDLLEVAGNATTGELTWKRKPRPADVKAREVNVLVEKAGRLAQAARPAGTGSSGRAAREEEAGGGKKPSVRRTAAECPDAGHLKRVQTQDT